MGRRAGEGCPPAGPDGAAGGRWEQICAGWESSTTNAGRRAALLEISLTAPVLPREVTSWLDQQIDTEASRNLPRVVLANIGWRTAMYFERAARNEHLRAIAA